MRQSASQNKDARTGTGYVSVTAGFPGCSGGRLPSPAGGKKKIHQLKEGWKHVDGKVVILQQTETDPSPAGKLWEEAAALFQEEPEQALRLLKEAQTRLQAEEADRLLPRILQIAASAHHIRGETAAAEAALEELFGLLERTHEPRIKAAALNVRAMIAGQRDDYTEAIRCLNLALEAARECGDPAVVGHLTNNLAVDFINLGDYERAAAYLEESLAAWERAERPEGLANALQNLGLLHSCQGDAVAAVSYYRKAYRIYRDAGQRRWSINVRMNLAKSLGETGQLDEAEALLNEAIVDARELGESFRLAHCLDALAWLEHQRGNLGPCTALWREAGDLYQQHESSRGRVAVLLGRARLPDEDAIGLLRETLSLIEETGLKPQEAEVHRALAERLAEEGRWEEAYHHRGASADLEKQLLSEKAARHRETLRALHELDEARTEASRERSRREETARTLKEVARLREVAEEESRQKTLLLKMAAHDLRNLVGAVKQSLELIQDEVLQPQGKSELPELVGMAVGATRILHETLANLMNTAAIERGTVEVSPATFDLAALLREVTTTWDQRLQKKVQVLRCEVSGPLMVRADPIRTRQVIDNLISNASKYSPARAQIIVEGRSDGQEAVLSVLDQGPGIPPSEQPLLFRPFQTLSPRPTGDETSNGLGLHIVKSFLERQGGSISMRNLPEGGSCFEVRLPLVKA
ncbi:MAG: hypothetical protein EA425_00260 [Puniceicoccaceae bacterium]|nr:MAG: hypothetical protein EA425_00260 [Puniceicoccaceae bacterium]